jgi:hypothetical protein
MRIPFIIAAALAVTAALAIEPPKGKPATPAASPRPAPPPSAPAPEPDAPSDTSFPSAETVIEEELPPLPPEAADAGPPPRIFTPTEKVRADYPVSYPIDI